MGDEKRPTLTTEGGAPVIDNQRSQTAGARGPTLLEDVHLVEKLARFNRERIPERVVHAVGTGAYGSFKCTSDATLWTKSKMFLVGTRTPVFVRFSTVAGSRGAADAVRDPRGFAIRFYTEEGNWDLVGNSTPVFFLRDGIKFPDLIHSQKPDPFTNRVEPDNVWDFFSRSPETTHQVTWLFGDRGIPASYRHMDGFGAHTFLWVNVLGGSRGKFWVKFHFKTDQGIQCLTNAQAEKLAAQDPSYLHKDLYDAIARKDFPSWTLKVQVMPFDDAALSRHDPFDLTKTWSLKDYPLQEVGKLVLDRVPDNYFAETEQAAFNPGNFIPGIGPSPDRMLQARLFAYADAQRYRLGVNHTRLPVNAPLARPGGAQNYGRDGAMRFDDNGGRAVNYEPNGLGGPAETGEPYDLGYPVEGETGPQLPARYPEDDDFAQAGALYRLMKPDEKERLVANLAASLAQVTRPGVVERAVELFRKADPEYGQRVAEAVVKLKK